MTEEQTEIAESSTAPIEEAASSAEQQVETPPEVPEAPEETEDLKLKRKTAARFENLDSIIKTQQATIDQLQVSQGAQIQQEEGEPREEDFENPDDYLIAKGAFQGTKNVINLINKNRVNQDAAQQNFAINQKIQAHTGRVQSFQQEHADFQQVINGSMLNVADVNGNLTVAAQVILGEPNSPAIEYHLAANPEVAMALNQANPAQVGAIIARLSDQLTVSPASVNNAPPPVQSEDTGTGTAPASDGLQHIGKATFE